jgi:hypothetical protein
MKNEKRESIREVKRCAQSLGWVIAGVLLLAASAAAQIGVGDYLKLGLSGNLSTGYTSTFGSGGSSHSMDLGGSGSIHGSYYSPQFFSFDAQPFYNRSQANSAFGSLTDSSGVTASANIFSGSHFPGSITYGKTKDALGQFGLPGVTGLSTKASGDTLGINWAAAMPDLPSLNVSYLLSGADTTTYGTNDTTHFNTRSLNLQSNYALRGFPLNAYYNHQTTDSTFPGVSTTGQGPSSGDGSNASYGFMTSHRIPMNGYWSGSINRSNYDSGTQSNGIKGSGSGTSDSANSTASVQLAPKLNVSVGANYQTNFLAAVQAQLLQAGATTTLANVDTSSKAFTVRSDAYYQIGRNIVLNGQWNHQQQYFSGRSVGITQFGGGVSTSYARPFLGSLTFSVGALDTATQVGNSGLGMYGNVNFSRRMFHWDTGADVNYSQQVQTLGSVYTTSVYGYGGVIKRKFGDRFYWTNAARQTHSGLSQQVGTSSHSENFMTTVLYKKYSVNAVYAQSGGTAIQTAQGLVAVPVGVAASSFTAPVLYNAKSFGGGISAVVSRFEITGSYSKALSDTSAATLANNSTTMWNSLVRCRMRKLYLNAGYSRFGQSVGGSGAPPSMLNSYFFGISRWFNVF